MIEDRNDRKNDPDSSDNTDKDIVDQILNSGESDSEGGAGESG